MKIMTIVGARPQFVKAAVVSRVIAATPGMWEVLVHTGQHYDENMSDIFFEEMQIPRPDYHLGIGGGSHGAMTGQMLARIETVIGEERPEAVLVYGDTNSTLAGALAAAKLGVPVAHVEAGLRSFNMAMPEEINRVLTDRISHWLFCPTVTAVANLETEGYRLWGERLGDRDRPVIHQVGDVMLDAALYYRTLAAPSLLVLELLQRTGGSFYLATLHRAENTDDPIRLAGIIRALDEVSLNTPVLLPIHPRTRKRMQEQGIAARQVKLTNPVGYFDMLTLLAECRAVFTDSGGVQKEAYFFRKPCITLREETEWVELVENGVNTLAGADYERIMAAERRISAREQDFSVPLYGDGRAGEKIVEILLGS